MSAEHRFLLMQAGGLQYALPLEQIALVTELNPLAPVPRAPVWCLGAIRSGGVVVAVADLAWYIGEEAEPKPEKLVVLDLRVGGLALQVGAIASIVLSEEEFRLEQDDLGSWLVTTDARVELLDARQLVQEMAAAMAR